MYALQLPFREYPGVEYENFPLPPDFQEETEFVFGHLMFPPAPGARFAWRGFGGSGWKQGGVTPWTNDYPRADRHFVEALRRLTRIHARSVEQPVNLDDGDDVFYWPWLYAVQAGGWLLTDAQVQKLREYLMRGGFLMADDIWGSREYAVFEAGIRRVLPDRPIVELENSDPIFHMLWNLDDRFQISGAWSVGGPPYLEDGYKAYWRGIYDDKGRLIVAIHVNSDTGDSWEWADDPRYPEKYSSLGIRLGVNYVVYAMTH